MSHEMATLSFTRTPSSDSDFGYSTTKKKKSQHSQHGTRRGQRGKKLVSRTNHETTEKRGRRRRSVTPVWSQSMSHAIRDNTSDAAHFLSRQPLRRQPSTDHFSSKTFPSQSCESQRVKKVQKSKPLIKSSISPNSRRNISPSQKNAETAGKINMSRNDFFGLTKKSTPVSYRDISIKVNHTTRLSRPDTAQRNTLSNTSRLQSVELSSPFSRLPRYGKKSMGSSVAFSLPDNVKKNGTPAILNVQRLTESDVRYLHHPADYRHEQEKFEETSGESLSDDLIFQRLHPLVLDASMQGGPQTTTQMNHIFSQTETSYDPLHNRKNSNENDTHRDQRKDTEFWEKWFALRGWSTEIEQEEPQHEESLKSSSNVAALSEKDSFQESVCSHVDSDSLDNQPTNDSIVRVASLSSLQNSDDTERNFSVSRSRSIKSTFLHQKSSPALNDTPEHKSVGSRPERIAATMRSYLSLLQSPKPSSLEKRNKHRQSLQKKKRENKKEETTQEGNEDQHFNVATKRTENAGDGNKQNPMEEKNEEKEQKEPNEISTEYSNMMSENGDGLMPSSTLNWASESISTIDVGDKMMSSDFQSTKEANKTKGRKIDLEIESRLSRNHSESSSESSLIYTKKTLSNEEESKQDSMDQNHTTVRDDGGETTNMTGSSSETQWKGANDLPLQNASIEEKLKPQNFHMEGESKSYLKSGLMDISGQENNLPFNIAKKGSATHDLICNLSKDKSMYVVKENTSENTNLLPKTHRETEDVECLSPNSKTLDLMLCRDHNKFNNMLQDGRQTEDMAVDMKENSPIGSISTPAWSVDDFKEEMGSPRHGVDTELPKTKWGSRFYIMNVLVDFVGEMEKREVTSSVICLFSNGLAEEHLKSYPALDFIGLTKATVKYRGSLFCIYIVLFLWSAISACLVSLTEFLWESNRFFLLSLANSAFHLLYYTISFFLFMAWGKTVRATYQRSWKALISQQLVVKCFSTVSPRILAQHCFRLEHLGDLSFQKHIKTKPRFLIQMSVMIFHSLVVVLSLLLTSRLGFRLENYMQSLFFYSSFVMCWIVGVYSLVSLMNHYSTKNSLSAHLIAVNMIVGVAEIYQYQQLARRNLVWSCLDSPLSPPSSFYSLSLTPFTSCPRLTDSSETGSGRDRKKLSCCSIPKESVLERCSMSYRDSIEKTTEQLEFFTDYSLSQTDDVANSLWRFFFGGVLAFIPEEKTYRPALLFLKLNGRQKWEFLGLNGFSSKQCPLKVVIYGIHQWKNNEQSILHHEKIIIESIIEVTITNETKFNLVLVSMMGELQSVSKQCFSWRKSNSVSGFKLHMCWQDALMLRHVLGLANATVDSKRNSFILSV